MVARTRQQIKTQHSSRQKEAEAGRRGGLEAVEEGEGQADHGAAEAQAGVEEASESVTMMIMMRTMAAMFVS